MTERSERVFGETPELVDPGTIAAPDFIEGKKDPKTFEDTELDWEIHKANLEAVKDMSTASAESVRTTDGPIKAKPYKVGDANLDEFPTNTAGLRTKGEGPFDRGELNALDHAGDDRKKIREVRRKLFH